MSEVTIMVKKIGKAVSKNGNPYQEITDEKGRTHRNFDPKQDAWVEEHLGKYITLIKEKAKTGNFMNIVGMREFTGEIPLGGVPSSDGEPIYKDKSIEGQVAAMEVGQNLRGSIKVPENVLKSYWGWLLAKLQAVTPGEGSATSKPPIKSAKEPPLTTIGDQPSSVKGEKIQTPQEDDSTSRFGTQPATNPQLKRILELNQKRPGRSAQLIKEWGWTAKKAAELTRDQARHLIDELEAEIKAAPLPESLPEDEELPFE